MERTLSTEVGWAFLKEEVDKRVIHQYALKLMKYCHHPECKYTNTCPRLHPRCEMKLNLHTAIAWNISEDLRFILT